jgi:hypothetical protein
LPSFLRLRIFFATPFFAFAAYLSRCRCLFSPDDLVGFIDAIDAADAAISATPFTAAELLILRRYYAFDIYISSPLFR